MPDIADLRSLFKEDYAPGKEEHPKFITVEVCGTKFCNSQFALLTASPTALETIVYFLFKVQ